MSFITTTFLFALAAGAGPFLIHLLNRRRHRTVEWAAMDFLREAIHRNKKLVELRDILLLLLRTLAVLLFVFALSQPYFQSRFGAATFLVALFVGLAGIVLMVVANTMKSKPMLTGGAVMMVVALLLIVWSSTRPVEKTEIAYGGEAVHAVIVLDNSLSMGYTQLDKTLLDVAKEKAREYVRALPKGSEISLIPLCQQEHWHFRDVYSTKEDALEAIDQLELIDRRARAAEGAELAKNACAETGRLPTKRVIFIGDMQENTWSADDIKADFENLANIQVVQVSPERRSNTWVSEFELRDGIADADAPAVFTATVKHEGDEERQRVRVSLKIDDIVAEERFVDLQAGQSLELMFKHRFDVAGTSLEPLFLPARLEISEDHLPHDDYRTIIVPVVANVPVLFVDQYGEREKPDLNRYGETFPLRRLLAPRTARTQNEKQLVDVRHRTVGEVSEEDLKEARLVVMAGIEMPSPDVVELLHQYIEQGGQVFIAAGAEFDPQAWNQVAWRDGSGILPAELKSEPIGQLPPANVENWPTFRLASNSFKDEVFDMAIPQRDRAELLSSPFFYKAVGINIDTWTEDAERKRLEERQDWLKTYELNERKWADLERRGELNSDMTRVREKTRAEHAEMFPNWIGWKNPLARDMTDMTVDQLIAHTRPRVMGRYDNGEVFAVRRNIGKGQVMMLTSGCFPVWNNIAAEHSVLIFDRVLRTLLTRSLPGRTLDPVNEIVIPIESRDQAATFTFKRPNDTEGKPISIEALGESSYGLIVRSLGQRGQYELKREGDENSQWTMRLAMNGPSQESELLAVTKTDFDDKMEMSELRWVAIDDAISLEGEAQFGRNMWKWLMSAVVVMLFVEMLFLSPWVSAWFGTK